MLWLAYHGLTALRFYFIVVDFNALTCAMSVTPRAVSAEPEAESGWVAMRVAVCAAADARAACEQALRALVPPRMSPSKDLLEAPIWTTWARYFSRVSQAKVLKYAHEIVSRGLQASTSFCSPTLQACRACLQ